jgi:HAE1 family hydrophobic/amphiphilic exporter-1
MTHVSVTIIVALVASLLVAQTLVPMLAARIPPPPPASEGAWIRWLTERYASGLSWILKHPWWNALGIVLLCVIGVLPIVLGLVKFDSFPQEAGRRLYLPYHIEGDHPLEQVEDAVATIEGWLLEHREELDIRSVYSYYEPGHAESVILLNEEDEATLSTREVIERIKEGLPVIAIGKPSFEFQQQGGGSEGFSVQLSGDSTERLNELAADVARALSSVEGLTDLRSDADKGEREVRVTVDRLRAAAVGLSPREVAEAISIAMRGQNLREFRGESGEVEVRLAFRESDKQSIEQLADLPLYTEDGRRIPLGSIADLETGHAADTIRRTDRQTAVVLRGNVAEGTTMDDLRPQVEALMNQFELPPGYAWKFGEGFERQDETQQMMLTNILLGIACIFLVMAALFESLLFPFSIILGSIAFSVFGVFLFFAATGTTFTFMASIGIMILIGVVVNNGIVLIDRVNQLRRQGMPRNEAIVAGGRDRLRPILMTVATTVVGLAPLAVSTTQVGGDGPAYFPMARAIIGGLTFSTVVSLLVVPALYAYFDTLSAWGRKVMHTARTLGHRSPRPAL